MSITSHIQQDFAAAQAFANAETTLLKQAVTEKWDGDLYHLTVTYGREKGQEIYNAMKATKAALQKRVPRGATLGMED